MSNETSRKAFETFAVTVYKNISLEKDDDGEYRYSLADVGWKYWQASRKALEAEQAQQVAVPAGYALVPIEPTLGMIAAGRDHPCVVDDYTEKSVVDDYRAVYQAMLAAAPQPPQPPQGDTP